VTPIPAYQLLAYCACAECDAVHYYQLAQQLSEFTEWEGVSAQAEAHGLGPLLYVHLQAAGAPLPPTVKRELQGLYLRHRQANRVRTGVLGEILTAYNTAGIQALVLKGAALSHLVYPEPGLRPMGDLDLLVKKSEMRQAQSVLADLGFSASLPGDDTLPDKHLTMATLRTEGLPVRVELHYNLFNEYDPVSMAMDDLTVAPLPFSLGSTTAYTLGYEDMLWHLCHHMALHTAKTPIRLIWVADIVSFAECFVEELDWERIRRQYPIILNTLSLLHFTTPLSETLLDKAHLKIGREPQGIGVDFQGWPRIGLVHWRGKSYWRILRDTFFPSEWWLRLYYMLGSTRQLFWYRWVWHPLEILRRGRLGLLERVGGHTPKQLFPLLSEKKADA
jgi:hypothetical protein